jgi:hydrogenase nickel incorporation protein HypA/HybF
VHELSLVQSLLDSLRSIAGKEDRRIARVNLRAGKMLGVVEDSLRFYFETVTKGTEFERTVLALNVAHPAVKCRACGAESGVVDWKFACSVCGSDDVEMVSGREFVIESVELEDAQSD